jgi:hypothetical protein
MFKTGRRTFGLGLVLATGIDGELLEAVFGDPRSSRASTEAARQELLRLWTDVLTAAKRDDRQRLVEMMASMKMSPEELAMLIGPDKARRFWPRYELLAKPLLGPAAAELVASIYEHHYDDVEVTRVDNLPAEKQSDTEKVVHRALVQPTPVYRVRIVRKGHPYAIRYDFFVYQHGFWKTGRELGKFLEPPPPINVPQPPVKVVSPQAVVDGGTAIVH